MKIRHDGLCEYVSRAARIKLVSLLLKNIGSTRGLARRLDVSHVAVRKWLCPRNAHPSNVNLWKIVELAVRIDSATATGILERDLRAHRTSFKRFVAGV